MEILPDEIERPFKSLTHDELWKGLLKRRTSPKQRELQLELMYRLRHLETEVSCWKDKARDEQAAKIREKKERKHLEKILFEG